MFFKVRFRYHGVIGILGWSLGTKAKATNTKTSDEFQFQLWHIPMDIPIEKYSMYGPRGLSHGHLSIEQRVRLENTYLAYSIAAGK